MFLVVVLVVVFVTIVVHLALHLVLVVLIVLLVLLVLLVLTICFVLLLVLVLLVVVVAVLVKVVFARSVSHRPGLSITPGGLHKSARNIIISFNKIESKIAIHLVECYVSIFWGVAITSFFGLRNSLRIVSQYAIIPWHLAARAIKS